MGRGNTRARNAKNGRFVTKAYAKKHPDTTVVETINKRGQRRRRYK